MRLAACIARGSRLLAMLHQSHRAGSGNAATGDERHCAEPSSRGSADFPDRLDFTSREPCYNGVMAKRKIPNPNGRKGNPISLAPLTMDQAVEAIFQIKSADVKKIIASKPGRRGKGK